MLSWGTDFNFEKPNENEEKIICNDPSFKLYFTSHISLATPLQLSHTDAIMESVFFIILSSAI